jgi:transposase
VFAVHGVNPAGKPELVRPSVPRAKLHEMIATLPPCTIGMEACSGAHHWARLFQALGHTVKLIAPKFVAPYRLSGKRGKNDAADAAAICEAVQRPNMCFVQVKSPEQQGQLLVQRARKGYVEARTATMTHECRERMARWAAEQPRRERPPWLVNPEVWPVWCSRFENILKISLQPSGG